MWLDRFLVLVGLLGLIVFCGVVMYYVAEPDLILVFVICLSIAIWDFWISVFRKQAPKSSDSQSDVNH